MFAAVSRLRPDGPTFETLRSLTRAAFSAGPEVAQSTPKKWRVNANVDEVLRYRKRW
jgi:hypothetical protein